jgi:hypothetical protein
LSLIAVRPEDLARLSVVDDSSYRQSLQRACQLEETAFGLPCFAMLATSESARPLSALGLIPEVRSNLPSFVLFDLPTYRVFLLADDLAAYRQVMKEMQDLAGRPYYEALEDWQEFQRRWDSSRAGIVTAQITPATVKIAPMTAEGDAVRQLLRVGLAMTAYRAKQGAYPDKLAELAPEYLPTIPVDPFDGQPLRMNRHGREIVLYSIGRDLKDDGGTPEDPGKHVGDIVFRLR